MGLKPLSSSIASLVAIFPLPHKAPYYDLTTIIFLSRNLESEFELYVEQPIYKGLAASVFEITLPQQRVDESSLYTAVKAYMSLVLL